MDMITTTPPTGSVTDVSKLGDMQHIHYTCNTHPTNCCIFILQFTMHKNTKNACTY